MRRHPSSLRVNGMPVNPVDRTHVRDVTIAERIQVRGIESPNRTIAAFFPSRGGFEMISQNGNAIHYFAFQTCVVLFITCMMFSIFGRSIVNKIRAFLSRRRLDVFWDVSEQGLLLAENILRETPDHEVLFRLPVSLRGNEGRLIELTHKIDAINCLWELSEFQFDATRHSACAWATMGIRHFFLNDSGHENIAQANRLYEVLPDKARKIFYIRVESSADQDVYLSWCKWACNGKGKRIEPVIVNESELIANDFAQRFTRLQVVPKSDVTTACRMTSNFRVLLIGLGKTGQAVLRSIACNGQLLKEGTNVDTGLRIDIIDNDAEVLRSFQQDYKGLVCGTEDELHLSFQQMDVVSPKFSDWLDGRIAEYNQIVLCLSKDAENIRVAETVYQCAKGRRCESRLSIVVKILDEDVCRYWHPDGLVKEKLLERIGRFGTLRKLYSWQKLNIDSVDSMARVLNAKWCGVDVYSGSNPKVLETIAEKWHEADYFARMSSRASARCEINLLRLMGYEVKDSLGEGDIPAAAGEIDNYINRNHWHPIHAKRTWMTPHKASLSVETGNYLKAI